MIVTTLLYISGLLNNAGNKNNSVKLNTAIVQSQYNTKSELIPNSFQIISNQNFRIFYPPSQPRKEFERVMAILDQAHYELSELIFDGTRSIKNRRIDVVFYETTSEFISFTGQHIWTSGTTSYGLIQLQPIRVLKNRRILKDVLRHEYTHALIESNKIENVPLWLNEGMALSFSGEGAKLGVYQSLQKLANNELDHRLKQVSTLEEQTALYAEAYRRVVNLTKSIPEESLWRRIIEGQVNDVLQ